MFSGSKRFKSDFSNIDYETCSGFINFNEETTNQQKSDTSSKTSSLKGRVTSKDLDHGINNSRNKNIPKKMFLSIDTSMAQLSHLEVNADGTSGKDLSKNDKPLFATCNARLEVANRIFTAHGHSKKSAKLEAAKKALSGLFNLECNDSLVLTRCRNKATDLNNYDEMPCYNSDPQTNSQNYKLNEDFAKDIGQIMMEANVEMFEILKDHNKWSVLAGIMLTSDIDHSWSDLISLTTGNKCIQGDSISMFGASINDSHSEILSRRCFLVYLYEQIIQLLENEKLVGERRNDSNDIIVQRCTNSSGYRLKPHIKVHMFISSCPCGDARITNNKDEDNNHFDLCGLLRSKSQSDEMTIPIKNEDHSSWDAVIGGKQKLRLMSCSDKLALWNIVGLQGSLLSNFLEPIYLESLTIGGSVELKDTYRALTGRLNLSYDSPSLKQLPRSFRLNVPRLGSCSMGISKTRIAEGKYSPSYSINHIKNKPSEIVCTTTGRLFDGSPSRLSKLAMLERFVKLLNLQPSIFRDSLLFGQDGNQIIIPKIYRQAKTTSKSYQLAKNKALCAFVEQNLGKWMSAPCEVDLFKI